MTTKAAVEAIVSRPYTIEFEYPDDPEDGILAYVVEWPDCFAAGRTREEAIEELGQAMRELAAYRLDADLEIPEPAQHYGGKVLLRMPRSLHRDAERRAEREGVSLNQWLTAAIAREVGPARRTTVRLPVRAKKVGRRR